MNSGVECDSSLGRAWLKAYPDKMEQFLDDFIKQYKAEFNQNLRKNLDSFQQGVISVICHEDEGDNSSRTSLKKNQKLFEERMIFIRGKVRSLQLDEIGLELREKLFRSQLIELENDLKNVFSKFKENCAIYLQQNSGYIEVLEAQVA